jgi:HSP20 family protein
MSSAVSTLLRSASITRSHERFYGRFERQIPIGTEIEEDKVEASLKNGVLAVTMPKSAAAQAKVKRIAINGKN